jgi:hypothetical protein
MIKIFVSDENKEEIQGWTETNSIKSATYDTVAAGTALGLTEFPAVITADGSKIKKVYATGMQNVMNLPLDEIENLKNG